MAASTSRHKVTDMKVVVASKKSFKRKISAALQDGYQPWGGPGYLQNGNDIRICQMFVRREA